MIAAERTDKPLVKDLLSRAFDGNQSVNYIVRQDAKRRRRLEALMDYSFDMCHAFGRVYLSEDRECCALVLFPQQKKATLKTVLWDLKLIWHCIGASGIGKALRREAGIKKLQPEEPMYYLWFIGTAPEYQNRGVGSRLMGALIEESESLGLPLCLETSTVKNLPWYRKFDFEVYDELLLSYRLFFLKRDLKS